MKPIFVCTVIDDDAPVNGQATKRIRLDLHQDTNVTNGQVYLTLLDASAFRVGNTYTMDLELDTTAPAEEEVTIDVDGAEEPVVVDEAASEDASDEAPVEE